MQSDNRTVVGIFSDITEAKRAADELHAQGISAARLVENDQAVTFTGTAERESSSGGVKGFFARLFGFEDRSDWKLTPDSETYFQEAYDKKHHVVVIEDCLDVERARAIITRMGGVVEEKGSQYYHAERARPVDRDESLDSGRRSAVDHAADSGLGLDVDRMPFAQAIPPHEHAPENRPTSVSDRISQSALSGTADHVPFSEQLTSMDNLGQKPDRSGATGRMPTPRGDQDRALDTGLTVPSERGSFAGPNTDDDLLVSADRKPAQSPRTDRALNGISGDADRTPLVGIQSQSDRPLGTSIVGDDRVHDRGVSNADVSRISSDRIMELGDDDQHLVDSTTGERDDGSRDNGHILPDRTYTPSRPQDGVQPAP